MHCLWPSFTCSVNHIDLQSFANYNMHLLGFNFALFTSWLDFLLLFMTKIRHYPSPLYSALIIFQLKFLMFVTFSSLCLLSWHRFSTFTPLILYFFSWIFSFPKSPFLSIPWVLFLIYHFSSHFLPTKHIVRQRGNVCDILGLVMVPRPCSANLNSRSSVPL